MEGKTEQQIKLDILRKISQKQEREHANLMKRSIQAERSVSPKIKFKKHNVTILKHVAKKPQNVSSTQRSSQFRSQKGDRTNTEAKKATEIESFFEEQKIKTNVIVDETVQQRSEPEVVSTVDPRQQRHIELYRYTQALRRLIEEKYSDKRLEELPKFQLCPCGALDALHNVFYRNAKKDIWQEGKEIRHRFQCANNCIYYGDKHAYQKALAQVIHSLQET